MGMATLVACPQRAGTVEYSRIKFSFFFLFWYGLGSVQRTGMLTDRTYRVMYRFLDIDIAGGVLRNKYKLKSFGSRTNE